MSDGQSDGLPGFRFMQCLDGLCKPCHRGVLRHYLEKLKAELCR